MSSLASLKVEPPISISNAHSLSAVSKPILLKFVNWDWKIYFTELRVANASSLWPPLFPVSSLQYQNSPAPLPCKRQLQPTVFALFQLGTVSGYAIMVSLDCLLERQLWIEPSLARWHLNDATLQLYNVSRTYLEGRHSQLAHFVYKWDKKKDKRRLVFGLLYMTKV